jgi:hypothetical protein
MGRVPAERTSLYAVRHVFENEADEPASPLDDVTDVEARFGSYEKLAHAPEFRFRDRDKERIVS